MIPSMVQETKLSPELMNAYRETQYCVQGPTSFILRIGQQSPELAQVHAQLGVSGSTFVTACNPYSGSVSDEENHSRMQRLKEKLVALGKVFWPGVGQHPTNGWPGEPSYLVFGLSRSESIELAKSLEQNATVWAGADAVPELLPLR